MAFENDYFKFSKPLSPTISGRNTRIEVRAGNLSNQKGVHTYNYNRVPLTRLQFTNITVNDPSIASIINVINILNGTTLKERDIEGWNMIVPMNNGQTLSFEIFAKQDSPRWLGSTKITVTLNINSISALLPNGFLNGFYSLGNLQ